MTRFVFKYALVALCTITLIGCGSSDESAPENGTTSNSTSTPKGNTPSTNKAPQTAQSTPEEAFNGFKSALEKDDWNEAFAYLTPDSQDMFLGGMIFGATFAVGFSDDKEKQESFEKLLKDHGVDTSDKGESEPPAEGPDAAMKEMKEMVANVKDKGACISALMDWMKENLKQEGNQGSPADQIKKAQIGEVKIEGDTATAGMTVEGQPAPQPMIFTKTGAKWYIDIIKSEKVTGRQE